MQQCNAINATKSNIAIFLTKYLNIDIVGMTIGTFTKYQHNEIFDKLSTAIWM